MNDTLEVKRYKIKVRNQSIIRGYVNELTIYELEKKFRVKAETIRGILRKEGFDKVDFS